MNIERKRLLKQRREKTLQNTRGKILAEEYIFTANDIKPQRIHIRERKMTMGRIMMIIQNIALTIHDINNLEIVANHRVNATTNDNKNVETELMNMDNINMAKIENDNNDKVAKSDSNDDNPIMSDKESPLE